MKVRILQPGKTGPAFSFPVIAEVNHSVYIQIEFEGKSYTFDLRQEGNSLTIRASDAPLVVLPVSNNMIGVVGPEDGPGRCGETAEANET